MSKKEKQEAPRKSAAGDSPKKKSAFKRFFLKPFLWIFSGILALVIIALALFLIFPGPAAELVVEHVVSKILDVKVGVEDIEIYFTRGRIEIRSLTIYNPEGKGYASEHAIHLGHVDAEIDPHSLFQGKKIVIRDLTLKDIAINYEADLLLNSNIQDIIDNINRLKKEEEAKEKEEKEKTGKEEPEEKGLEVDHFVMKNVGLYIVTKGTTAKAGIPLTIDPMGPIGNDTPEGVSPLSFALRVMSTILVDASKQAGIQISDAALGAAESVVSLGTDAVNKATDHLSEQGKKAADSVKSLF